MNGFDYDAKLAEAYATGFRNGQCAAYSVNDDVGRIYQIDDSLLKVNVRLSEYILNIEVMRKRFGHWEILQGISEAELHRMERDSVRTEFEVRARLKQAGIELAPSSYDGENNVSNFPTVKLKTTI